MVLFKKNIDYVYNVDDDLYVVMRVTRCITVNEIRFRQALQ